MDSLLGCHPNLRSSGSVVCVSVQVSTVTNDFKPVYEQLKHTMYSHWIWYFNANNLQAGYQKTIDFLVNFELYFTNNYKPFQLKK